MSQFLLDLEVAIFKAWGEAGHIAESLVAARVAADQCTDQHAELMKNFTNQAIPDLSPATVELLRVRHPEFCSSETGQAALSQRVRGIKKSTRAANAAANLSHAQDMFWLWVGTGLLEEDGAVASLQDIHSKLRESIRRYRTCQARIVS
ncbi:MAG TPA: hypothetical protein VN495_00665, partial [Candidatus Paceibacterota bacterium]|nr:hypothetical protein [Candidatus Paceibacterota bacterium]